MTDFAGFILQRSLSNLDPSAKRLDEVIITLPGCKFTFTVEASDGHCRLQGYYERTIREHGEVCGDGKLGHVPVISPCVKYRRDCRSQRRDVKAAIVNETVAPVENSMFTT